MTRPAVVHGLIPVPDSAWRLQALCAGPAYEGQRDLWYPMPSNERGIAAAQSVCRACPVRQACLDEALREEGGRGHEARHGIRGGLTGSQRRRLYERKRKAVQAGAVV